MDFKAFKNPLKQSVITAFYKQQSYKDKFGFEHYGLDLISRCGDTNVYAPLSGIVLHIEENSLLGKCMVTLHKDVAHPSGWLLAPAIVIRYFHLREFISQPNDYILSGDPIANYGKTGQHVTGSHLHIEFDCDSAHPLFTPTITTRAGAFKGTAYGAHSKSMVNPLEWII